MGGGVALSNAITLKIHLIKKNFVHNYCKTCHSFQRNNIDDAIAIFDHKFAYVSRMWFYTATKAMNLKQVYFYYYDESKANYKDADTVLD